MVCFCALKALVYCIVFGYEILMRKNLSPKLCISDIDFQFVTTLFDRKECHCMLFLTPDNDFAGDEQVIL